MFQDRYVTLLPDDLGFEEFVVLCHGPRQSSAARIDEGCGGMDASTKL